MSGPNSFQSWLDICIDQGDKSNGNGSSNDVASRLRQEARSHFEKLSSSLTAVATKDTAKKSTPLPPPPPSSSPSRSSTVEQDISNASSATPNGALALLVSSLGPAFVASSSSIDGKVRALHCLTGALEGSASLTQGVRQAVGRFLVELCRPESYENESDEEGSDDGDEIEMDQPMMDYVDAANLTPDEITQQLEAMGKAKEQSKKYSSAKRSRKVPSSYAHDDVRDAAMNGLKALLQSQLEIFPTQLSQSQQASKKTSCPVTEAMEVVYQSMELRVELAMLGVRYRCESEKNDSTNVNGDQGMWGGSGAGYETSNPELNIEDGLSKLPRLKRSLCFNLLEGALDGLKEDELRHRKLQSQSQSDAKNCVIPESLLKAMSTFTSLTSSCMHGETDPRCLLQLLCLLNKVQQIMLPVFAYNENNQTMDLEMTKGEMTMFPSIEVFDSVAPYYPVQFTPPKNDPHGITRDMLQGALMAVLCERGAVYNSRFVQENNGGEDGEGKETMIMLAGRMFLERLEPPKSSEYDPPSSGSGSDVEDKLDAARDLSSLFLTRSPSSINGAAAEMPNRHFSKNLTRVTPAFLSELSSSMARVHEEAASSDSNSLASAIRKFSSSLAHSLEPVASIHSGESNVFSTASLWEAYVVDILRHLTPILGSAPQGMHGRASTAYLASLAAEGGLMTLKKVLEGCYPRFLGTLSLLETHHDKSKEKDEGGDSTSKSQANKQKSRDEEKLAAAMRGIAALVSSCRVALQKYERENSGVQVYPHPLSLYTSATLQKIASVLNEPHDEDEIKPLSLAAVGALESVLTSADLSCLEEEDMSSLEKMLSLMSQVLLSGEGNDAKNQDEWKAACARVLGAVIAIGLCKNEESGDAISNSNEKMNACATSLLPQILASATASPPDSSMLHAIRYDWIVLAQACANGTSSVSKQIISELLAKMIAALRSNQNSQIAPVMALSYLVRHGGPNVGAAFHGLSPPGPTPFDFIRGLCQALKQPGDEEDDMDIEENVSRGVRAGLSVLQLPDSRAKDEEVADDVIKLASSVLPFLIPAYECPSSVSSCGGLVQFVDQILPPLSKWDEVKLYVAFPLLAAVLNNSNQVWSMLDSATMKSLRSMVPYLAEFIVSSDHNAHSRSAAASCLFSVLFHSSQSDNSDSDIQILHKLLEEVLPSVTAAVTCLENEANTTINPRAAGSLQKTLKKSMHSSFSRVEDTLSFVGLLGSAAACKGGPFSQTSDKIASFLIELACTGTSQFPCTETTIQLARPSVEGQKDPFLNPASHAYILPASAFGGMLSVHNGGPFWRQRMTHKTLPVLLKALQAQARSQNPPALGTLTVVCHMLCCLPASLLGESNVKQILPTMVAGLVYFSKNLDGLAQSKIISSKPADVLSIILAALIKMLAVSPEDVTKFIRIIIPSLLLLCPPTGSSETYIPKQLLVFQCLETVATHPQARNSILREKDQVVAVLSVLMDHPSMIVRNAVVQVRNVWFTLE